MKIRLLLSTVVLTVLAIPVLAQQLVPATNTQEYQDLKIAGKLPTQKPFIGKPGGSNLLEKFNVSIKPSNTVQTATACNCMQTVDNTYSVAPFSGYTAPDYRNDDGSTDLIPLPFNFCLYGSTYNSLYINNNGNVSFGTSYPTYSASGFPDPDFIMVAPFWADVDTRNTASGLVYYKITPTAMIVRWQNVGYFNSQADKINDFQLIITDGTDPIIPLGNNVSFCYGDMQWTTGSASGGTNGFGGTAATVGANKGDGTNFIQFGRFDAAGNAYDGPFGNNDGISWLDNQSFFINTCSGGNNISPIVSGISICDTLRLCVNSTVSLNLDFLSPEQGQNTTVTTSNNPGLNVTLTPGNPANITGTFTGQPNNVGLNTILITATDNGTPPASSVIPFFIEVIDTTIVPPTIIGNTTLCQGQTTGLLIAVPPSNNYTWQPTGTTNDSLVITGAGVYSVTLDAGLCSVTSTSTVTVSANPPPTPIITAPASTCFGDSVSIAAPAGFETYIWSTGDTTQSIIDTAGTYTVTVTDTLGCTGTSAPFTIIDSAPTVNITGVQPLCHGDSLLLTANPAFTSYSWSDLATTQSTYADSGVYYVVATDQYGCVATDTVTVTPFPVPTAQFTQSQQNVFILGQSVSFTDTSLPPLPDSLVSWQWSFSNGAPTSSSDQNPTILFPDTGMANITLIVTNGNGCTDTVVVSFEVIPGFIPNVFTPDGDGNNDLFVIPIANALPNCQLTIFNRWGKLIYKTDNYKNDWDGENHSDGVYYYVFVDPTGKDSAGTVTILRKQ